MHCNGITSRVNGAPCAARGATQQLPVLGSQDNETALILAAKNKSSGVAKLLLDVGANPVVVNKVCCVAMSMTCDQGMMIACMSTTATHPSQNMCSHHAQANQTAFNIASGFQNTNVIKVLEGQSDSPKKDKSN